MRHLIALILASVLVASCNHSTPTAPGEISASRLRALYGPQFGFTLQMPADSNGTLKGMIFHGPGYQTGLLVQFEPQTHTLEGTLAGNGELYTFELWSGEGSLVPGSFKVLSGPVEQLTRCAAAFINRTASPEPMPIRVQFTVQDSPNGECHR